MLEIYLICMMLTLFWGASQNWKLDYPPWAQGGETNELKYRFLLAITAPISWLYLIAKWAKKNDKL